MLDKIYVFPVLLIAACLTAGVYGAVHNQISYTVSPEYFHVFKFKQFDIAPEYRNRFGAAMVGWYASWWMGFLIGVPVLLVGLIMPGVRLYWNRSLQSFVVVAVTALLVGLGALEYASMTVTEEMLSDYWIPDRVTDGLAFTRAGTMHNFSYTGGFIGIVTGSVFLIGLRTWKASAK